MNGGDKGGLSFITLRQLPGMKDRAAAWFHGKWGVPVAAYTACMNDYLDGKTRSGGISALPTVRSSADSA